MRYVIGTRYRSCAIVIPIEANKVCNIFIEVHDSKEPHCYLTKRFRMFNQGEKRNMVVQMPLTGNAVVCSIFDNPDDKDGNSPNFSCGKIKLMSLPSQLDVVDMTKNHMKEFIRFCGRFCFNAGSLPTFEDKFYVSDAKHFRIKYVNTIMGDSQDEQLTPARISKVTKVIEAAKSKFINMTVPGRFCILSHEYCHLFVNEDMHDELEADLNGLSIYLGLGFPRIEAKEIFYSTFYQSPTEDNLVRLQHIEKFMDSYENIEQKYL